jgi:hypothetical protein
LKIDKAVLIEHSLASCSLLPHPAIDSSIDTVILLEFAICNNVNHCCICNKAFGVKILNKNNFLKPGYMDKFRQFQVNILVHYALRNLKDSVWQKAKIVIFYSCPRHKKC